jgi:hypothetical protein
MQPRDNAAAQPCGSPTLQLRFGGLSGEPREAVGLIRRAGVSEKCVGERSELLTRHRDEWVGWTDG